MLPGFFALALVDSINPSAIAVTLLLLSRPRARTSVAVYVATIFLTYLTIGAALVLGLDAALPAVKSMAGGRLERIVQGVIGLVMLGYSIAAPKTSGADAPSEPRAASLAALVVLGVTVTAMELPTALPYFGAVALLTAADLPLVDWLPLLVTYTSSSCCRRPRSSWGTRCSASDWRPGMARGATACGTVLARRCCGSWGSLAALSWLGRSSSMARFGMR